MEETQQVPITATAASQRSAISHRRGCDSHVVGADHSASGSLSSPKISLIWPPTENSRLLIALSRCGYFRSIPL